MALAAVAVVVVAVAVVVVLALSMNLRDDKTNQQQKGMQPSYPPREGLQGVVDEVRYVLWQRGLSGKVATLGINGTSIMLGFLNKPDPEIVEIVQSIIDKRAPNTPLEIFENITIIEE